jgi:hypothetical protein
MNRYSSMEEYAEHIRRECNRIMGAAAAGLPQRAGALAAALCTEAAGIVQAKKMEIEQAGGYDLAALRVDAASASNSETPFEND